MASVVVKSFAKYLTMAFGSINSKPDFLSFKDKFDSTSFKVNSTFGSKAANAIDNFKLLVNANNVLPLAPYTSKDIIVVWWVVV